MRTRFCRMGFLQTVLGALVLGVGAAWGDVAISRVADGYKVTVDAGTVPNRSYLTLAWDTTDAGEDFAAWTNTRVLASDLAAAGGTFTTSADDIPEGSFVRAFITQSVELLGGAVELADQVWIDTGCSESGTYGMDVGVRLTGRSCNWASVMGATIDKFTIGTNDGNLDLLYLRLAGTDTGARATLDNTQCNQMVIRDRDWIVNGTTVTHVNGTGALYPGGTATIHLGTTAARNRFTSGFWYWARFFGADGSAIAALYPAHVLPQDQFGFFDTVKGKMVFPGTGTVSASGDVTNTVANVLAVSAVAEAVDPFKVVAAYWTGAAGDGAVANPANWSCRNAMDEVVAGGLPGLAAAVHLEGTLNLDFTAASVLTGRTFTVNGTLTRDTVLAGSCVTAFEGMSTLAIPGRPDAFNFLRTR